MKVEKGLVGKPKLAKALAPSKALVPSKSGSTQNMATNIKVAVRVRPLNDREMQQNNRLIIDVVDQNFLIFDPKEEIQPFFYHGVQQPNKNFLKRANKELKFVFDNVCGVEATNQDVFEVTTKDMLTSLMEGYNCSVFVYGATGAGKTFTMIGSQENPGITYLTMQHLFYSISSFEKEREFDISVSYIEVYNENVYDLLKPSKTALQLREDSTYGVVVAGLTHHKIKTPRELLNMLDTGNKNRTQHPTDANAESSRSHAVFQVYIGMRYKTSYKQHMVKLSMIDLAGSERASATNGIGDRFKEGANINKSLLALGNCFTKLADGCNYIPYRDSKLTRLLKDSLHGNCKTVMIANVSPSGLTYEDTYNTLKYAARANKIQMSVKKNIVDADIKVAQYVKIHEELTKKVQELEAKLALSEYKPDVVTNAARETDLEKEKVKTDWYKRLSDEGLAHSELESNLLVLMSAARVLALRQHKRTRAFAQLAELAHRSSTEAMDQMCTEDLPRQERAAENYRKQSTQLESKVLNAWTKWNMSRQKMQKLFNEAITACPEMSDYVKLLQRESETRHAKAQTDLLYKLLSIEHNENDVLLGCIVEMPHLIKNLYLTLKGTDKVSDSQTAAYLGIMKQVKHFKGVSWLDEEKDCDAHFKLLSTLDMNKPANLQDVNTTVEIIDSDDDMNNIENKEPLFEQEFNSTFVLAGKVEPCKRPLTPKPDAKEPVRLMKRALNDATNTTPRPVLLNDKAAKIVKPLVGKAVPFRRNPLPVRAPAFGSSLARNGTLPAQSSLQESSRKAVTERSVGFKAVRGRGRLQAHPYSRSNTYNGRN